jgi:iron uptake system component EfeO
VSPAAPARPATGKNIPEELNALIDRRGIRCLVLALLLTGACNAATEARSLETAAASFRPYVLEAISRSLAAVQAMRERIDAQDLAGAQRAWLAAREGWEGSEVVTGEFFPQLDRAIDGWPDADKGFHAIEAKLFGAHDLKAEPAAAELVSNLEEFKRQLQSATLTPQGLINGTTKLVYEIGESKGEGGESPYSGNSLVEIGDNLRCVEATWQRVFEPAVKVHDPAAARSFTTHLHELRSLSAVATIQQLDQVRLRDLSESVANDLVDISRALGLKRPQLGN